MARPKGSPKLGGRKKGTPNRVTTSMRQAWLDAFERLGGVESLVAWGQSNPDDFYKAVTKLIPTEIVGNAAEPLVVQFTNEAARRTAS